MQNIDDKNKLVKRVCKFLNQNLEYFDNQAIKICGFYYWIWKPTTFLFPTLLIASLDPPSMFELQQRKQTTRSKASINVLEKDASHEKYNFL